MRSTIQSTMRIASSIIKTKQINNNRLNINISKIYGSQITSFSTKKGDIKEIPDNFFDDEVEKEKEFLDIATALAHNGGLENLTTVKDSITWNEIDESKDKPISIVKMFKESKGEMSSTMYNEVEKMAATLEGTAPQHIIASAVSNDELASHLTDIYPRTFLTEEMLNYSMPMRKKDEFPHAMLDKFIPHTSKEKFRFDKQGYRACEGKLQRRGMNSTLGCHIIDMDSLDHLDILTLRRFVSDDSEILGRKHTGLCAKCQRKVAKTIKKSRNFGIMPHLGEFIIQDSRPVNRDSHVHDTVQHNDHVISKTIL